MTPQIACQIILAFGVLLSAAGGFGSFYFGKIEEKQNRLASNKAQSELRAQIDQLQASFDTKIDLIFQAMNVKPDEWKSVQLNNVPAEVADFALILFRSDRGRISGKVRIKGSKNIAFFSTSANARTPVAVANVWDGKSKQYVAPAVLEFSLTEKTDSSATLSVFTAGWIDSRGQEPHLAN
jgi:hypothetical protein